MTERRPRELKCVAALPDALCCALSGEAIWAAAEARAITLDGFEVLRTARNVFTLRGLEPGRTYEVGVAGLTLKARTRDVAQRLDARDFGAKGDGVCDDTKALQAAIDACPDGGLIVVPPGDYVTAPLFLKGGVRVRLDKGATLCGVREKALWPIMPGIIHGADGRETDWLGSWEGEAMSCHAALLNMNGCEDVIVYGEGVIDGQAGKDTWWEPGYIAAGKTTHREPARPRLVGAVDSARLVIEGVTLRNSPSWTVHPNHCRDLIFANLKIEAPADSPNTDGLNPESCEDVRITGVHFAVGDDCIAIKSGKLSMARRALRPTRRVHISNCLMQDGHGAVVIGSEMASGVYDVAAEDCLFIGTDRGLRIKTRRGRGRDAVVRGLTFRHIRMEGVGTAFVINSFYWCDPDGRTDYVGDRKARPVDDGTPSLGGIRLEDIDCLKVRHAAAYLLGLPEQPIEGVTIDGLRVRFDPEATPGEPDMAATIPAVRHLGVVIHNARDVLIRGLDMTGQDGAPEILENVTCSM